MTHTPSLFAAGCRHRDQDGSIVLAMLAAMIVSGLALVLLVNVGNSQQLTRKDRDYNLAVNVADAGLQQALTELSQLPTTAPGIQTKTDSLQGGTFTWKATRRPGAGDLWDVRAVGKIGGSTRVLEAEMGRSALFALAAYGKEFVDVKGGGGGHGVCGGRVCSYTAAGKCDWTAKKCLGELGSAGLVDSSVLADHIWLYAGATDKSKAGSPVTKVAQAPSYPDLAQKAFAAGGACAGKPITNWDNLTDPNGTVPLVRGETYCFERVTFGSGQYLLKANTDAVKNNKPVTIFIAAPNGKLWVKGGTGNNPDVFECNPGKPNEHACVNIKGDGVTAPIAADLQFYMQAGSVFDMSTNSNAIAATVYNPLGSCKVTTKASLYGAMVCGTVESHGGMSLYYDERLRSLFADDFGIREWREELQSTTSQ